MGVKRFFFVIVILFSGRLSSREEINLAREEIMNKEWFIIQDVLIIQDGICLTHPQFHERNLKPKDIISK